MSWLLLNASTLIWQQILKNSGCSQIIFSLAPFFVAASAGLSNSFAVSEQDTVGPISSSSCSHRYIFTLCGLSTLIFQTFLLEQSFPMFPSFPQVTNMLVSTVSHLLGALPLVKQSTSIFTSPLGPFDSLSTWSPLLTTLSHLFTHGFTKDVPHFKESIFLKLVKQYIVDWPWPSSGGLKGDSLAKSETLGTQRSPTPKVLKKFSNPFFFGTYLTS